MAFVELRNPVRKVQVFESLKVMSPSAAWKLITRKWFGLRIALVNK
jgi:hypothetical protein